MLNTNEENPLISVTKANELNHKEPITKLEWLSLGITEKENVDKLLSVGADGKIFLWDLSGMDQPSSGSQLFLSNIPASLKPKGNLNEDMTIGILSATTLKDNTSDLIIGSESGLLFKCSLTSMTQLNLTKSTGIFQFQSNDLITYFKRIKIIKSY